MIRRCLNGATQYSEAILYLRVSKRRELKHLSTCRKGDQLEIPQVVASERGRALKSKYI